MSRPPAPARRWRPRRAWHRPRGRPARSLGGGLAAALLLGGCGGIKAPDLFLVQRTGTVPGARLTLLVNEEGGVRCNGGRTLKLGDAQLVEARGMKQVTDLGAIEKVVDDIIAANPDKVEQARAKPQLIGWFVGQVMKASGGKANPQAVNDLLKAKLGI